MESMAAGSEGSPKVADSSEESKEMTSFIAIFCDSCFDKGAGNCTADDKSVAECIRWYKSFGKKALPIP
jgi:hypothetical protein